MAEEPTFAASVGSGRLAPLCECCSTKAMRLTETIGASSPLDLGRKAPVLSEQGPGRPPLLQLEVCWWASANRSWVRQSRAVYPHIPQCRGAITDQRWHRPREDARPSQEVPLVDCL